MAATYFRDHNILGRHRVTTNVRRRMKASSINDKFRELLIEACRRPGMYVGRDSLQDLSHLFTGYCAGAKDAGELIHFGERFQRWIEGRFAICSSGWNWVRILQHECGDDQSAIASLPALYDEFRTVTDNMTDEEIWDMMEHRLAEVRGTECWCPDDSETWTRPTSEV